MLNFKSGALKWSNLFFLIPLVIALNHNIYWYSVIIFVLFIVSFDFHFFNEAREVFYLDLIFSILLVISNFILLYLSGWQQPLTTISLSMGAVALFFYFRRSENNYSFTHSLWHILSAVVCVLCLTTFL